MKWNHPLIAAHPFLMALAFQSAMFNLMMTAPRKTKPTAEVISITAKADRKLINKT